MRLTKTDRGFEAVEHPAYPPGAGRGETRLLQQSSAIGDGDDGLARPGSAFLWVGRDHHLTRAEVAEAVAYMRRWLETGSLGEPVSAGG
jgi:hypothetical protein